MNGGWTVVLGVSLFVLFYGWLAWDLWRLDRKSREKD